MLAQWDYSLDVVGFFVAVAKGIVVGVFCAFGGPVVGFS